MVGRRGWLVVGLAVVGIGLTAWLADWVGRWPAGSTTGSALTPPDASPGPGVYPGGVSVALQPYQARGQIVLTVDGSAPTDDVGTLYTGPVRFDAAFPGVHVLRAAEIVGDGTGPRFTGSYVVGVAADTVSAIPVISLVVEPADLWSSEYGILANTAWRGSDWERPAHATFFLGEQATSLDVGLRVDSDAVPSAAKQSLRLYARQDYGEGRVTAPLFPSHARQSSAGQSYKRLLLQAGEHGVVWSLLRDQIAADIARDLGLPVAEGRLSWLFINGESWGLYRLTERVDRFMLADGLGLSGVDVLQEGNPREGVDDSWDALIDLVDSAGLNTPDSLHRLSARVDLDNLTDFAILKELFGFPAEALVAVRPQGGRWIWVFEGAIGAGGDQVGSDLQVLVSALLSNREYRDRYRRRAAALANTVLDPASVATYVDRLDTLLSGHASYERARWAGVPSWTDETVALERVYADRWHDLADGAGLVSPLALHVAPPGAGELYLDGIRIGVDTEGWHGQFADETSLDLAAVPGPGYAFVGWSGAVVDDNVQQSVRVGDGLNVVARFAPLQRQPGQLLPDDVVINELWINDDGTPYPTLGHRGLEGDWVELLVRGPEPVDLRGWRITDNNTKTGDTEGSLILPPVDGLSVVPCGTVVLLVASESAENAAAFPTDDLDARDGRLILFAGNGALDVTTDPGFGLGTRDDNVVLLAPGPTQALPDDVTVDFVAEGLQVTPYTFGALADGVTFDVPFDHLGRDDGAAFVGRGSNNDLGDWIVDPTACQSHDQQCLDTAATVTPGRLNPGQGLFRLGCLFDVQE